MPLNRLYIICILFIRVWDLVMEPQNCAPSVADQFLWDIWNLQRFFLRSGQQIRHLTQSTYIVTGKSRAEWHSSSWCSWSTVAVVLWGQVGQNLQLNLDFSSTTQQGMAGGGSSRGIMRNLRKHSLEDSSRWSPCAANEVLHRLEFVLTLLFIKVETMICGNIYIINLVSMEQYQKSMPQRKRRYSCVRCRLKHEMIDSPGSRGTWRVLNARVWLA